MTRLRALLRGLLSFGFLAAMVAGVPWALLRWSDWPITGVPTWEQVQDAPTELLTDSAVLGTVVVALWLAWVVVTASVLAEVVNQVRGAHRPSISLGGPVQRLVGGMLGSVVVTFASTGTAVAAPALPGAAPAELPDGTVDATAGAPGAAGEDGDPGGGRGDAPSAATVADGAAGGADTGPGAAGRGSGDADAGAPATVTVDRGDTPWSLAETHLGDGMRWRDIWELNRGAVQPDGSVWDDPAGAIQPGWDLRLPARDGAASPGSGAPGGDVGGPAGEEGTAAVVEPGDHFWELARSQVASAWGREPSSAELTPYWQEVVDANRHRLLPPHDPDLIYPEQVFTLPPAPADPQAPAPQGSGDGDGATAGDGSNTAAEDGGTPTADRGSGPEGGGSGNPGSGAADGATSGDGPATGGEPRDGSGSGEAADPSGVADVEDRQDGEDGGGSVDGSSGAEAGTGDGDGSGSPDGSEAPPGTTHPDRGGADAPEGGAPAPGEGDESGEDGGSGGAGAPASEAPGSAGSDAPGSGDGAGGTSGGSADGGATEVPLEPGDPADRGGSAPRPPEASVPGSTGDGAPGTTGTTVAGSDGTPVAPTPAEETASASPEDGGGGSSLLPVGLIAGGVALGGVVVVMERRRRVQLRRRRRGDWVVAPPTDLRDRETQLRGGADVDGGRLLDVALRAAAAGSGTAGLPRLRWVEASPHSVNLVLAEPSPPPPGFRQVDGDRWQTGATLEQLEVMAASAAPPAPSLVPVGATADGYEVFIELESDVVTTVDATREEADSVLRALAAAVSTAPWSEHTRVILVGMDGDLTELPWVTSVGSLDEALLAAEVRTDRVSKALGSVGSATTGQARAAGVTPEEWDPLIILSAAVPEEAAARQRLAELAHRSHRAVGLVMPAPAGGERSGRTLAIGPDGMLGIDGVDVAVWPRLLGAADAADIVALLDVAGRREDVPLATDPGGEGPRRPAAPTAPAGTVTAGTDEAPGALDPVAGDGVASGVLESPGDPGEVAPGGVDDPAGAAPVGPEGAVAPLAPSVVEGDEGPVELEAIDPEPVEAEPIDPEALRGAGAGAGGAADVVEGAGGPRRPDGRVVDVASEVVAPDGVASGDHAASGDDAGAAGRAPARRGEGRQGSEVAQLRPSAALTEILAEVDVLIRVLGEVEAVRLGGPSGTVEEALVPARQKGLEAVTYLALRESGVDREDLEISLFPDGSNSAKTMYNTISAARNLVGDELFPAPDGGRYVLSEQVVTDYGLFCELVTRAEETDDAGEAADLLAGALSLVRGEPFVGVGRSYAWVGQHRGMIVAQVIDAADELGEVRLAQGDWRAAELAARQGLRAFPSDERMYRLLMRSARAAGNVAGVQRVFRELCDVVADPEIGVEPEDTLHPDTVSLFEELTGSASRGRLGA